MTPPDGLPRALVRDPRLRLLAEESGYEVLGRIGAGGMGIVYRALDADGRDVAIKLLRPEIADDPRARARLAREVAAQQRVRHDNIARILDAELDSAEAFVATEFVPGPTLEDAVRDHGALHPEAVREIGLMLGETLRDIHAAGIVHRDLKPSNVLLRDAREADLVSYDPDGAGLDPVVIDFGIAQAAEESRLTSTGLVMGTAAYLDPEVVATNSTSAASDWWSWAALVAFAATGREPFGSGRADLVFFRAQRGEIDVDGLPTELAAWLRDALRADPAHREDPEVLLARLEDLDLETFDDPGETEAFSAGPGAVAADDDASVASDGTAATQALPVAAALGGSAAAGAATSDADMSDADAADAGAPFSGDADRTQALPALGDSTEDLAVQGATEALAARGGGATEVLAAGPGATAVLPAGPGAMGHSAMGYRAMGHVAGPRSARGHAVDARGAAGPSTPVDADPSPAVASSEPDTEIMDVVREPTRAIPVIRDERAPSGPDGQGRSASAHWTQQGRAAQGYSAQGHPGADAHAAARPTPTQSNQGQQQRPAQPQGHPHGYPGSSRAPQQPVAQRPSGYPPQQTAAHPGHPAPQQGRPAMHPQQQAQVREAQLREAQMRQAQMQPAQMQPAQLQLGRVPQRAPHGQQMVQQRPPQSAAGQIYAPYGFGPDGRPLGPPQVVAPPRPPRRPLLTLFGHVILIALAAVVPYIALAAMLVLGAVSRTWERSHRSIQAARYRGKASGASWTIGLAAPFRFLLGLLEMALQALFPLLLGLVLAVCADALAHYGAGMILPSGALFAGTMAVTLLLTWVGLGSRTTRDGAHRMLDSAAPDHVWGGVIAVLLALLLGAVIVTIGARTGQVDYFPFVGGPRLDELLPWRA